MEEGLRKGTNNNHFFVFLLLWLTSYYVIHAYWVGPTLCGSLGLCRECIQCGQSIVSMSLLGGHTCVCPSCRMPERQLIVLSAP